MTEAPVECEGRLSPRRSSQDGEPQLVSLCLVQLDGIDGRRRRKDIEVIHYGLSDVVEAQLLMWQERCNVQRDVAGRLGSFRGKVKRHCQLLLPLNV